jgi:hypothetical protein
MGFKSRLQPSEEVRRVMSGRECLLFQATARRVGPAVAAVDDGGAKAFLKKAEIRVGQSAPADQCAAED